MFRKHIPVLKLLKKQKSFNQHQYTDTSESDTCDSLPLFSVSLVSDINSFPSSTSSEH